MKNNSTAHLDTIDGATLMAQPRVPIPFIVRDLIPNGLHILSGAPKIGKSFLVLWLCQQVALGEAVWSFATERKTVLYLALEDSRNRIHNRLCDITEDSSPNIFFATELKPIGDGLETQIENFVAAHSDTGLVVIDTLQKVRRVTNENAYGADYRDLGALKSLANKLGIAILLVHHTRKQPDENPMNTISGTTGITGAVDGAFVLIRDTHSPSNAVLHCSGRDIESRELELRFDRYTCVWELVRDRTDATEVRSDTISVVCGYMNEQKFFRGTPAELADALAAHSGTVTPANVISKRLNKHTADLQSIGITCRMLKVNGARIVELTAQGDDGGGS